MSDSMRRHPRRAQVWSPRGHASAPDARLLAALRRPVEAPDVTDTIMARLGYRAVVGRAARRERLRRVGRRGSIVLCACIAMGLGLHMHNTGPDARRPVELTLPAAIEHEWDRHERAVDSILHRIRQFVPAGDSPGWNPDAGENQGGTAGPDESGQPVDWSMQSPFRWA